MNTIDLEATQKILANVIVAKALVEKACIAFRDVTAQLPESYRLDILQSMQTHVEDLLNIPAAPKQRKHVHGVAQKILNLLHDNPAGLTSLEIANTILPTLRSKAVNPKGGIYTVIFILKKKQKIIQTADKLFMLPTNVQPQTTKRRKNTSTDFVRIV